MGIDELSTQVAPEEEQESGGPRRGQQFPPDGNYEVVSIDTETTEFQYQKGERAGETAEDHKIILELLDEDGGLHNIQYKYRQDESGKLDPRKGGGKLRIALDDIPETNGNWDVEGKTFYFETTTFPVPGNNEGRVWRTFLPTMLVEGTAKPAAKKAPAKKSTTTASSNGASSYSEEAVAATISIIAEAGEEGLTQGEIFRKAAKLDEVKSDKDFFNALAAGKALKSMEGIVKDGDRFVLA